MKIEEYGYEYDAIIREELYKKTLNKNSHKKYYDAYVLRSGRDALKAISREFSQCIAMLPALSCDSMILPFKMYGHIVCYYKLDKSLKIDYKSLRNLIISSKGKKILFLYMNYFGIESISKLKLEALKKEFNNLVFINDITHVFPYFNINKTFDADYYVASIRKWINIPDGGLLWCKNELRNSDFEDDTTFAYKRLEAQQLRNKYFITGNIELKKEYRRIFSSVSKILDDDINPSSMSMYSYEIFKNYDVNSMAHVRRENAKALIDIFKSCSKIKIIQDDVNVSNLYVPITIDDRNVKQEKLNKLCIYNTIIWPLNEEQKNVCKNAKYVEEHMLAIPCDQRYTIDDMKFIANEIVRIINEEEDNDIRS